MKKRNPIRRAVLLLLLFLAAFTAGKVPAAAEEWTPIPEDAETAEWTVLFYMCGSDLESKHGFATSNLKEIATVRDPISMMDTLRELSPEIAESANLQPGRVNVLFETGGCREWHTEELDMEINPALLQRWRLVYSRDGTEDGSYHLEQELPGASMADPDTLADFIRWGHENYPAKQYALVLWDHGGGAKTGLFIDELYEGDIMYLDELGQAMRDGGVRFEAVLLDACMMANLETAYALKDNARWMIASEENVTGKGTAYADWLQQLMYDPVCDGKRLGRWICDMTMIKASRDNDEQTRELMTWSLLDLTQIRRVVDAFDRFCEMMGDAYAHNPYLMAAYAGSMTGNEEFGSGKDNMWDLATIFYGGQINYTLDEDMRREILDAVMDTVVYNLKGPGRSKARGLSFCFASDFSAEQLDIYARNCPSAHYLAFLDAMEPDWEAPAWVYETAERLPESATMNVYTPSVRKTVRKDGTPGFTITSNMGLTIGYVRYRLYKLDEQTNQVILLGLVPAYYDWTTREYCVPEMWRWPSIDGVLCEVKATNQMKSRGYDILFNIPIQINTDSWNLRCGYQTQDKNYTVYGLWAGFDSDNDMFDRNVRSLAQVQGLDYRLRYEVDGDDDEEQGYQTSEKITMYRALDVVETDLPAGTYYVEFVIYDLFNRAFPLERAEVYWDGTRIIMDSEQWTADRD